MKTYPHLEACLSNCLIGGVLQVSGHNGQCLGFLVLPSSHIICEAPSFAELFAALEARLIELKRAAGSPEFCTADAPGLGALVTPDESLAPEPAQPTAAPELPAGGRFHRLRDGRKVLLVSGEHENWRVTFCREGFDKTLTRLDAQEDLSKSVFEELDGLAKQHA